MFYTCLSAPFSLFPKWPNRSFGYLGGETEALQKFILLPTAELVPVISSCCEEPLHVTSYISHLLFCPYTVWDSFEFVHLLTQPLPAQDQHGLSASAATRSWLTNTKSNDAGGFSVGPWSKIMVILQHKALLFSDFAAFPQLYSSPVWGREAKRGIKRKWQVLSLR